MYPGWDMSSERSLGWYTYLDKYEKSYVRKYIVYVCMLTCVRVYICVCVCVCVCTVAPLSLQRACLCAYVIEVFFTWQTRRVIHYLQAASPSSNSILIPFAPEIPSSYAPRLFTLLLFFFIILAIMYVQRVSYLAEVVALAGEECHLGFSRYRASREISCAWWWKRHIFTKLYKREREFFLSVCNFIRAILFNKLIILYYDRKLMPLMRFNAKLLAMENRIKLFLNIFFLHKSFFSIT